MFGDVHGHIIKNHEHIPRNSILQKIFYVQTGSGFPTSQQQPSAIHQKAIKRLQIA
jgi:hypothetical protein